MHSHQTFLQKQRGYERRFTGVSEIHYIPDVYNHAALKGELLK